MVKMGQVNRRGHSSDTNPSRKTWVDAKVTECISCSGSLMNWFLSGRFSECGPQTGSISITWELFRSADSQAQPSPGELGIPLGVRPSHLCFNQPSGRSWCLPKHRTTVLKNWLNFTVPHDRVEYGEIRWFGPPHACHLLFVWSRFATRLIWGSVSLSSKWV